MRVPTDVGLPPPSGAASRLGSWLERPLSSLQCVVGWCVATAVFVGWIVLLGGLSNGDATQVLYPSWAFAHGQFSCAFPPHTVTSAPMYSVLAAGIEWIARIGHTAPFPRGTALGSHCDGAATALVRWSDRTNAKRQSLVIGFIGWVALLAGLVVWLRASGRGHRIWEPVVLVGTACLPSVWMCLASIFHPQDLLATGFALAALGCARSGRWIWTGMLLALAVLSQQFAVLVLIPLLVLAERDERTVCGLSAVVTWVVVAVPLLILSGKSAIHEILFGTGTNATTGGTVLWNYIHGPSLVVLSRVLPIVLSLVLAVWARKRFGPDALQPIPLTCLIALSLGFRLVFEINIYGYYFMALSVLLLLIDVARGRLREAYVAWLLAFSVVCIKGQLALGIALRSWNHGVERYLPLAAIAVTAALVIVRILGRRWFDAAIWLAVMVTALLQWTVHDNPLRHPMPLWFWQMAFALTGLALAARPMVDAARARDLPRRHAAATPPLESPMMGR